MMLTFAARALAELLAHGPPVEDTAPDPVALHDNVRAFGLRDLAGMTRRDRVTVDASSRRLLVMHQTGVEFGVASPLLASWRARLPTIAARDAAELAGVLVSGHGPLDVLEHPELYARRLALASRFWSLPYHYVITRCGLVLWNAPLEWRTHHGNLGNHGLGVAIEGKWPARGQGGSALDIEAARRKLAAVIEHARSLGSPIDEVSAHRCFAPPSAREGDPGVLLWREVIRPVADASGLRIDYSLSRGQGRPIPVDWDDRAYHDWRGRKTK